MQWYAVDLGHNITLPCTAPHKGEVQWSRAGRNMHSRILEDGSLQILDVNRGDAGIYACTPANDARENLKQEINLTVRSELDKEKDGYKKKIFIVTFTVSKGIYSK